MRYGKLHRERCKWQSKKTPQEKMEKDEGKEIIQTRSNRQTLESEKPEVSRSSQTPSLAVEEHDGDTLIMRGASGLSRATAANISSEVMFPTHVGRLAIFDDYLFCGDVGSGSFGKVMLVRHKSTKHASRLQSGSCPNCSSERVDGQRDPIAKVPKPSTHHEDARGVF